MEDGSFEFALSIDEKFPDATTTISNNAQTVKPIEWSYDDGAENGIMAPRPDNIAGADNDWRAVVTLPVDLISFKVIERNCHALLTWKVQQKVSLDYFEIEYSTNGRRFDLLARLPARGGSFIEEYTFTNSTPDDWNIYRLKMVNRDGSFAYSEWVALELNCSEVDLYPNPVHLSDRTLTIDFGYGSIPNFIDIYSELGVQLYSIDTRDHSREKLTINLDRLSVGTYYVKIGAELHKFIVLQ